MNTKPNVKMFALILNYIVFVVSQLQQKNSIHSLYSSTIVLCNQYNSQYIFIQAYFSLKYVIHMYCIFDLNEVPVTDCFVTFYIFDVYLRRIFLLPAFTVS